MRSVIEAVIWGARQRPDDIAVTDGTASVSDEALWRAVEDLAAKLAVLCAGPGAMGLCLDNSAAWVALDLALVRLGRPVITLPVFFTEAQRRHALEQSGAQILITGRSLPVRGWLPSC